MKDKEFNKHKNKINKLFIKWIDKMGLRWYKIKLIWERGAAQDRDQGYKCVAITHSKWEYRDATITVWVEELSEATDTQIERTVVHELCHVFVEQMREEEGVTKNEEAVCENLASAFIWVSEKKKK